VFLTKTVRSQAELLLTNTAVGAGGALQSALQNTAVNPALLRKWCLNAEFGSRSPACSYEKDQLIPNMCRKLELLDHRCDSGINKSIESAEIWAGDPCFSRETNATSVQRNGLFIKYYLWPM